MQLPTCVNPELENRSAAGFGAQNKGADLLAHRRIAMNEAKLESAPEAGTAEGQFFHRTENPFGEVDNERKPDEVEADDELGTTVPQLDSREANCRTFNSKR